MAEGGDWEGEGSRGMIEVGGRAGERKLEAVVGRIKG